MKVYFAGTMDTLPEFEGFEKLEWMPRTLESLRQSQGVLAYIPVSGHSDEEPPLDIARILVEIGIAVGLGIPVIVLIDPRVYDLYRESVDDPSWLEFVASIADVAHVMPRNDFPEWLGCWWHACEAMQDLITVTNS